MPAPLKFIQYHWAQKDNPRSRVIGHAGKFICESSLFLLLATALTAFFSALDLPGAVPFSFTVANVDAGSIGLFGVLILLQYNFAYCTIITEEMPADYP